jgi:hypothetical protein
MKPMNGLGSLLAVLVIMVLGAVGVMAAFYALLVSAQ